MNCQNCGTSNNIDSKFCIKCGMSLSNVQSPIEQQIVQNENNFQSNSTLTVNNSMNNRETPRKVSFMEYIFIILAVILKPFTAFKEELNKFNTFKTSAIMSLIVSGTATIINLITSMLNVVREKSFSWSSGGYKTTWVWENLKELNYIQIIGKNFLIYLGIIVVISALYYIASLIIKKQTNFSRLLGISSLAVSPMLICSLVLSPLLSMIWVELAMPIIIIGIVYTIVLLYEVINDELLLEGNTKYYFNLICLSILGILAYYLYVKIFMSSISGGLEDIMDLFG